MNISEAATLRPTAIVSTLHRFTRHPPFMHMAASCTTNVDVHPAKPLLPVRLIEESIGFTDGKLLVFADDKDIYLVLVLTARLARPPNQSRTGAKMAAEFLTAYEAIPSVEVRIQKQMLTAAASTLGDHQKEKAAVDFGGTRYDFTIPIVSCPSMLHLKRIAATEALDMPCILMLFGFRRLRHRASSQMLWGWNHFGLLRKNNGGRGYKTADHWFFECTDKHCR